MDKLNGFKKKKKTPTFLNTEHKNRSPLQDPLEIQVIKYRLVLINNDNSNDKDS